MKKIISNILACDENESFDDLPSGEFSQLCNIVEDAKIKRIKNRKPSYELQHDFHNLW